MGYMTYDGIYRLVGIRRRLWGLHDVDTACEHPLTNTLAHSLTHRSEHVPANLIQAQRDYFGAHTYELLSNPGKFVHTNWTGHGGNVSASTYDA